MPKFVCSYAHDIARFADFVVEAETEKAALRKIRKALREGKFQAAETTPYWENGPTNERVFVQGPAKEHSTDVTLEQLVGEEHVIGYYTHKCVRCGRSADENTVEHIPCHP
jgi:hypothetical protein